MGEPETKVSADYFNKLKKQLQKQKKNLGLDQKFNFNAKYVKAKQNAPKSLNRGPKFNFPYLDSKFPAPARPPPRPKDSKKAPEEVNLSNATIVSESLDRPRRKTDAFVNLPVSFFADQDVPRNLSIFEPEIQIAEINRSIATANSTIFNPPVTSTPFGVAEDDFEMGEPPVSAIQVDGNNRMSVDGPEVGEANDQQDLEDYKTFVEALAKAAAGADEAIFPNAAAEFNQVKEYLQKVMKHTAPSPAPPAVKKSYCSGMPTTTDKPGFDPFLTPIAATQQHILSETLLRSPVMSPLVFSQISGRQLFGATNSQPDSLDFFLFDVSEFPKNRAFL